VVLTLQGLLRLYQYDFEKRNKQLLDWVYIPSLEQANLDSQNNRLEEYVSMVICPRDTFVAVNTREVSSHKKGKVILFRLTDKS
jgi:hypothetical protein